MLMENMKFSAAINDRRLVSFAAASSYLGASIPYIFLLISRSDMQYEAMILVNDLFAQKKIFP